jgi:hypothetical protein
MSYVIQNFLNLNKSIITTPRFKKLILNSNFMLIFYFFSFVYTIKFMKLKLNLNFLTLFYFRLYFRFFIINSWKFFLKPYSDNYPNNFLKSIDYWNFKQMVSFKFSKTCLPYFLHFQDNLLFNSYFVSIKIINYKINKTFFDKAFFCAMIANPFFWFCPFKQFNFFFNFIFIEHNLQFLFFYNNFFLNVYNY